MKALSGICKDLFLFFPYDLSLSQIRPFSALIRIQQMLPTSKRLIKASLREMLHCPQVISASCATRKIPHLHKTFLITGTEQFLINNNSSLSIPNRAHW